MGARYVTGKSSSSRVGEGSWSESEMTLMASVDLVDWQDPDDLLLPEPWVAKEELDPLMIALVGLLWVAGICLMIFAVSVALLAVVVMPV